MHVDGLTLLPLLLLVGGILAAEVRCFWAATKEVDG